MQHLVFKLFTDAFALLMSTMSALAEPSLLGREVTFQVITYDDPAQPMFEGGLHKVLVSGAIEFGLGQEGVQNELDVVPILVDISANRVEISYATAEPGELWSARFNGYVIAFRAPCDVITRARVDQGFTNLPFDNKRVSVDGNRLLLNVSGQKFNRKSRIGVDLTLAQCPSS